MDSVHGNHADAGTSAFLCGAGPETGGTFASGAPNQFLGAGAGHSCVVATNGRVYCWGSNKDGEVGDGTEIDTPNPGPVLNVENAIAVSAGSYHACALIADGTVRCWGWNVAGQVGDGTMFNGLGGVLVKGVSGAIGIVGVRTTPDNWATDR